LVVLSKEMMLMRKFRA